MPADSELKLAEIAGEMPDALPWFKQYREEYMRMLRFSEHETFDHPVACELSQPLPCPACIVARACNRYLNMFPLSSRLHAI